MSGHKHQCGLITVDEKGTTLLLEDGYGCHHVWEHNPQGGLLLLEKVAQHKCPKCGRGPWYAEHKETRTAKAVLAAVALLVLQACAVVPGPTTCFANFDHLSHPLQG